MSGILGADFREVIRGRVCVDGVLYSHPDLAVHAGKEVRIERTPMRGDLLAIVPCCAHCNHVMFLKVVQS